MPTDLDKLFNTVVIDGQEYPLGDDFLEDAKQHLERVRQGRRSCVENMHQALAKANASLADIGTSEQEIAALVKASSLRDGANQLHWARLRNNRSHTNARWFEDNRIESGMSYEDFGTTEEEIKELLKPAS